MSPGIEGIGNRIVMSELTGVRLKDPANQLAQSRERADAYRRSDPLSVKRPVARRPSQYRRHVGDLGKVRRLRYR
jgi:hypothetical protein